MLISTRYTPAGWLVDENTANFVPEFREVLSNPDLGVKALAFVALATDPTSFIAQVHEEENLRREQSFISVYDKGSYKTFVKNKVIAAALSKYEEICETPSIKLRRQFRESIKRVGDFIEKEGKTMDLTKFSSYITALAKLPEQIKEFDAMGKEDESDIENVKKIVRGGRELSYLEQRAKKKRKG